jgi:hypothetical protein
MDRVKNDLICRDNIAAHLVDCSAQNVKQRPLQVSMNLQSESTYIVLYNTPS